MPVDPVTTSMMNKFANLNDRDLRHIAYNQASDSVDDKKHRKMNNRIFYSIPLAAGIAAAAKTAPRVARVANFILGAASWALPFLAVDTVILAKKGIEKHSQKAREFQDKHPMLSILATAGVSIAGYLALTRGGLKHLEKNKDKVLEAVIPAIAKLSDKLEASKLLNKASSLTAKIPSSVKDVTKGLLDFTPWALLFTSFFHSVAHEQIRTAEYINNYHNLKSEQAKVREALTNEEV